VTEALHPVELTSSFLAELDGLELFLAEAASAYDDLITGLQTTVVPNLARFPLVASRYLDQPPQSLEALQQLAGMPVGAIDGLRVYLQGDYLMLYSVVDGQVSLLSIRHHRQLSFDFAGLWPN
jgi:hypothetical protein